MPTLIVALLVTAAIVLLASSLLNGRRDNDPSSSVHSFQRALSAMGTETPRPGSDTAGREPGSEGPDDGAPTHR